MRGKRRRFSENEIRDNVLQQGKNIYEKIKGNWCPTYFNNNNSIVVELACGRGEYTVGMARLFPDQNFIGVDIKGDRIWKGSGIAIEENLYNVAFLRTEILQLERFFTINEVSEIWITFPDPRPRDRDIRRRLTSGRFLDMYKSILDEKGWIHLKTDSKSLFEFTLETLKMRNDITDLEYTFDLYHSGLKSECFDIRTRYEEKFSSQGHDIKYLKFRFQNN